jgi:hypothetical protein
MLAEGPFADLPSVMVGLDPTIHEHRLAKVFMGPRVKPEGDETLGRRV